MVEGPIRPRRRLVAGAALGAVAPFMFIVGRVTAVAGVRDAHQLIIEVASFTFHIHVSAFQRETCELVIDGRVTPVSRIMTALTLVPQPTFMHIVGLVTGAAVLRR